MIFASATVSDSGWFWNARSQHGDLALSERLQ